MKMKRLLTLTLAGMMVAGTSLSAAAANATPGFGFNPPEQEEKVVEFDADKDTFQDETIPVYGYVGPDAVLLDEEPGDGTVPPTVVGPDDVEYLINVSVPVKILWAVFDSDTNGAGYGTVTSPDYYIRNNSEQLSVSITALSFEPRTGYPDNGYVDGNWYEDLTLARKQNSIMNRDVVLSTQETVSMGNLLPEEQMEFDVQGTLYVNGVDNEYRSKNSQNSILDSSLEHVLQPRYDLTLKIGALTN